MPLELVSLASLFFSKSLLSMPVVCVHFVADTAQCCIGSQ